MRRGMGVRPGRVPLLRASAWAATGLQPADRRLATPPLRARRLTSDADGSMPLPRQADRGSPCPSCVSTHGSAPRSRGRGDELVSDTAERRSSGGARTSRRRPIGYRAGVPSAPGVVVDLGLPMPCARTTLTWGDRVPATEPVTPRGSGRISRRAAAAPRHDHRSAPRPPASCLSHAGTADTAPPERRRRVEDASDGRLGHSQPMARRVWAGVCRVRRRRTVTTVPSAAPDRSPAADSGRDQRHEVGV